MKRFSIIAAAGFALGFILTGCSKTDNSGSSGGGSTSTSAGSAVELKLKWVMGKKYIQHMDMKRGSKAAMGANPVEQMLTMNTDYSVSVPTNTPGGGEELEMEFLGQKLLVTMGGRTMASFDSTTDAANDSQNPMAPLLRKMVGLRIQYETDTNGHVQKVLGLDAVIDRLGGNTPQGAMVKSLLTEDALKQYVDIGWFLPGHAVKTGDTWPAKKVVVTGPVTTVIDQTYTFTGWEDHNGHKCAKLDFNGTVAIKNDSDLVKGTPPGESDGQMSGTTWFDPELGMIIENSSTETMTVKSTPKPGQTVTAAVTQKAAVKLMDMTDIK